MLYPGSVGFALIVAIPLTLVWVGCALGFVTIFVPSIADWLIEGLMVIDIFVLAPRKEDN